MPRCDSGTGSSGAPCAETKSRAAAAILVRSSSATSSATTLQEAVAEEHVQRAEQRAEGVDDLGDERRRWRAPAPTRARAAAGGW